MGKRWKTGGKVGNDLGECWTTLGKCGEDVENLGECWETIRKYDVGKYWN
jgi:hypothetical protein